MSKIEHSGKITLIINILRRCSCDKVQVFNQSLHSLNLVEEFLAGEDERYRVSLENHEESFVSSSNYIPVISSQYLPFDIMQHRLWAWRLGLDYCACSWANHTGRT
jgi:hypothetical protein